MDTTTTSYIKPKGWPICYSGQRVQQEKNIPQSCFRLNVVAIMLVYPLTFTPFYITIQYFLYYMKCSSSMQGINQLRFVIQIYLFIFIYPCKSPLDRFIDSPTMEMIFNLYIRLYIWIKQYCVSFLTDKRGQVCLYIEHSLKYITCNADHNAPLNYLEAIL